MQTISRIACKELIAQLPKSEIHLHIEGLASFDTLWQLIQKHNLKLGISSREELEKRFMIHTLNEFVDLYINVVQACFLKEEDIIFLINDTINYLKKNNIRYAEIFFSPTKLLLNGIPYPGLVEQLTVGAARLQEQGMTVRFISDVSRSYGVQNAHKNLRYHFKYPSEVVIGMGLGGSERRYSARDFQKIFDEAIDNGLHVVAHAGEDLDSYAIWDTIRYLKVQRIGHGISAYSDATLMRYLREHQIPLEICPTSNLYTGRYVTSIKEHPLRTLFNNHLHVTINSDDPTIFSTDLNGEYAKLLDSELYSIDEIIRMLRNGIYATFMSPAEKNQLWLEVQSIIQDQGYAETLQQFEGHSLLSSP